MRSLREHSFFLLQRLIGSRAGREYRRLKAMESWTREQLTDWQQRQLLDLINHAKRHVPFYRNHIKSDRLVDFPTITKTSLSGHYRDLMSDAMQQAYKQDRRRGYTWMEVTSGGTTGIPTTVIHDPDFRDKDRASRVFEQHLCGFPFGTPHFRLWGSMHDIQHTTASRQARIMSALSGEILLNAFQMEDDRIRAYLRLINDSRVEFIIAYVDAMHQLALFARRHQIAMRPLRAIMTTGGTLTDDLRTDIHDVFHARIHNKYGSRDAGEIACECEHGGLHLLPHIIAETVDASGAPLPPGQVGRLLITFLGNFSFPLIRFDITDMAALSDQVCKCGRPFFMLEKLEGRATDFLSSSSGGFVSPVYIRHVIGVVHARETLRRYQLEQRGPGDYILRLQPEQGVSPTKIEAYRDKLLADLRAVLGETSRIEWLVTASIPETRGGKFQYIINRGGRG